MLYSVDFVVHLHGKFALHEKLIVQIFREKILANLSLFNYPCVGKSYVYFGIVQLSIFEELLCALCIALHCSVIHV